MFIVPHLIGRTALSVREPAPDGRARGRAFVAFLRARLEEGQYLQRSRDHGRAGPVQDAIPDGAPPTGGPDPVPATHTRPGLPKRLVWEGELSESQLSSPLLRGLVGAGVIVASVGTAYTILSTVTGDTLLLGPGLGIPIHGVRVFRDLVRHLRENDQLVLLAALGAAAAASSAANIYTSLQGYFRYEASADGNETFPTKELGLYSIMNLVNLGLLVGSYQAMKLVGTLLGFDAELSLNVVTEASSAARNLVISSVPTLVRLHPLPAFLVVFQVSGIFHYILHRCGHELRLFWLLFHRQHHFPTLLHALNTPFVVSPFPLSMFMAVPYHLLFSSVMKLFVPESSLVDYLVYYVIYKLIYMFADVYAHQTGLYHRAANNKLMWGAGLATGSGVHHYLHHSSLEADGEHTNITNIGGGFFFIWDRVFRTYRPAGQERPPIGLTGDPVLHENPIRLALAGMAQLTYELRHNKSRRERALILLGHTSYVPPISMDFAIKQGR